MHTAIERSLGETAISSGDDVFTAYQPGEPHDALGYQFVKVTDSSPAGTIPLPEARALITPRLREQKKKMAENAYALDLLKNSGVTWWT